MYSHSNTEQKATIHQVTTSKNVLYPGHNCLLTNGADEPTLWLSLEPQLIALIEKHSSVIHFKSTGNFSGGFNHRVLIRQQLL